MIVRILNKKENYDKFWDCFSACITTIASPDEFGLYIETREAGSITIVLTKGDEIYYMNNEGRTINTDHRMLG